ncbi:hypothetical protein AB4254_08735 [Vibrio breoganii]
MIRIYRTIQIDHLGDVVSSFTTQSEDLALAEFAIKCKRSMASGLRRDLVTVVTQDPIELEGGAALELHAVTSEVIGHMVKYVTFLRVIDVDDESSISEGFCALSNPIFESETYMRKLEEIAKKLVNTVFGHKEAVRIYAILASREKEHEIWGHAVKPGGKKSKTFR